MLRILIIKTSSLGDIIQSLSVISFLKEMDPNTSIDWVVEKPFKELLDAHPDVDYVIPIETKKWKKAFSWKECRKAIQNLRKNHYDVIFDLQGNIKSGLVTFFSKGKKKVGYSFKSAAEWPHSLFVNSRYHIKQDQPISLQYLSFMQKHFSKSSSSPPLPIAFTIDHEEEKWIDEILSTRKTPYLMVCLGSNWENKKLSLKTWEDFLQGIEQKLHPTFFFIWGNLEEKKEVEKLHEHFSANSCILPKMRLPLWQSMMAKMDGIISVDSSALHLAATTQTRSFSLFGPSSSRIYKPIGDQHHSLEGKCPYGQVFEKRCPRLRNCKTGACLKGILSEDLITTFLDWWN